jgi:hypothetical protein
MAEADLSHLRYFKRLWPLALRVIETAVRAEPERAEDVAAILMSFLSGPVRALRWVGEMAEGGR